MQTLIVGLGLVKVLNAFTGKEAHEILEKLVGQEEI